MQELTQKIIDYLHSRYTVNYKKWYIGISNDIKGTKKEFQKSNEIVCEYMKSWPCKNKTQARQILKELAPLGVTICKKSPETTIFAFLSIDKAWHKTWKKLNTQKRPDYFIFR